MPTTGLRPYEPDEAWLLPPSVKDVLRADHLCFFLHRVVEELDLSEFEEAQAEEGPPSYAAALMVKVWLYAYALQITSLRRLERSIREDLRFRYLAVGATTDHWTLNDFRRQHGRAINDLFLQAVEVAHGLGMGRLGHVAVDSTQVRANASPRRTEAVQASAIADKGESRVIWRIIIEGHVSSRSVENTTATGWGFARFSHRTTRDRPSMRPVALRVASAPKLHSS